MFGCQWRMLAGILSFAKLTIILFLADFETLSMTASATVTLLV